jgi:hypothetical protein
MIRKSGNPVFRKDHAPLRFSSRDKHAAQAGGGKNPLPAVLTTILLANEHVRGTLFELPHTIPEAHRTIETSGLSTRCEAVEGDFFMEAPADYDAYILPHVLHDWNDEHTTTGGPPAFGRDFEEFAGQTS